MAVVRASALIGAALALAGIGPGHCQQAEIVAFASGLYLEDHPAHDLVQGGPFRAAANLTFDALQFRGPVNTDHLLAEFTTRLFRDEATGQGWPFGPTLRTMRGGAFDIRLTNNLIAAPREQKQSKTTSNIYKAPDLVSLHAHGLHAATGVPSQPAKAGQDPAYIGDDNFFTAIQPKLQRNDTPDAIAYHYSIPLDHLPGVHWYHPHHMGSSMLQQTSASGVLVVEDDPYWLSPKNCSGMLYTLGDRGLVDRILHVEGFFMANASAEGLEMSATDGSGFMEDSYPSVAWKSNTRDPLCCNSTRTRQPFMALGEDFTLINGIFKPVIRMTAGVWQRWRVVNAAPARYLDLTLVQPDGRPSGCELALFAKDGVYLLSMPRNISHVMLPGAGRAEVLVRCPARSPQGRAYANGERLVLRSGEGPTKPSEDCTTYTCYPLKQDMAVLELAVPAQKGAPQPWLEGDLAWEACQPLRPAYAQDLRAGRLADLYLPNPPRIHPFQLNFTPTSTRPIESYGPEDADPVTSLGPLALQLALAPGAQQAPVGAAAQQGSVSIDGDRPSPSSSGGSSDPFQPSPGVKAPGGSGADDPFQPSPGVVPPNDPFQPSPGVVPPPTGGASDPYSLSPGVVPPPTGDASDPFQPSPGVVPPTIPGTGPSTGPGAVTSPGVAPGPSSRVRNPGYNPGAVSAASLGSSEHVATGRRLQALEQRRRLLQRKGGVLGGPERAMYGCSVNHETERFPDPNPIAVALGTVQEWDLLNIHLHSFHLHVQPYQLTNLFDGAPDDNFFQVGDYHDVLLLPMGGGTATIRFQPTVFAGYSLVHCHVLPHTDQGCAKVVAWQCPGVQGNDPQPSICRNATIPVPGDDPGPNPYLPTSR